MLRLTSELGMCSSKQRVQQRQRACAGAGELVSVPQAASLAAQRGSWAPLSRQLAAPSRSGAGRVGTRMQATAMPPQVASDASEASRQALKEIRAEALLGTVVAVLDGMVAVDGFSADVPLGVGVTFAGGWRGLLLNRNQGYCFVLPMTSGTAVPVGTAAQAERSFAVVPPGEQLLGQTVDGLSIVSFTSREDCTWCACPRRLCFRFCCVSCPVQLLLFICCLSADVREMHCLML